MRRIQKRFGITQMYDHSENNWVSNQQHAEIRAIKGCNSHPNRLVVLRFDVDGDISVSKPCNICQKYIEMQPDLDSVYYGTRDGEFVKEKV